MPFARRNVVDCAIDGEVDGEAFLGAVVLFQLEVGDLFRAVLCSYHVSLIQLLELPVRQARNAAGVGKDTHNPRLHDLHVGPSRPLYTPCEAVAGDEPADSCGRDDQKDDCARDVEEGECAVLGLRCFGWGAFRRGLCP